jgi:hypothetical protein
MFNEFRQLKGNVHLGFASEKTSKAVYKSISINPASVRLFQSNQNKISYYVHLFSQVQFKGGPKGRLLPCEFSQSGCRLLQGALSGVYTAVDDEDDLISSDLIGRNSIAL